MVALTQKLENDELEIEFLIVYWENKQVKIEGMTEGALRN